MNDKNDMSKDNSIFIGEGVVFKGSIKAPNQAIISGKFDGELDARDVLIGASGVVTGKTTAQFLDVKGDMIQRRCADPHRTKSQKLLDQLEAL